MPKAGRQIRIWTDDGLLLRTAKNNLGLIAPLLFRNDNEVQWVGLPGGDGKSDRDGAVWRFDLKKNRSDQVASFTFPKETRVWRISADQQRLATYSKAGQHEIAILTLEAKAALEPLEHAVQPTPSIAFSKTGYKLAWTGPDRTKLIAGVDLETAEALPAAELKGEGFGAPAAKAVSGRYQAVMRFARGGLIDILQNNQVLLRVYAAGQDWVVCTQEGYYAASPGGEKKVGWHVNNGPGKLAGFYPFERFRKKLYRPDVIALVLEKGNVATALKVADVLRGDDAPVVNVDEQLPPRALLTVVDQSKLPTIKLKVQAEAATPKQPVTALRLLVDGRPLPARQAYLSLEDGRPKAEAEWTIDLPEGKHTLSVLARSPDASAVSPSLTIEQADPSKLPVLHVLAIGINDYKDQALKLAFAAPDAQTIADGFQKAEQGKLFRQVSAKTLLNGQADSNAVLKEIAALRKSVKPNDLAVVFFAGHGVKNKEGFYLLTVEADTDQLDKTALAGAKLRQALGEFPCQVLLMLDACQSGGFGTKGKLAGKGLKPATDDVTRSLTEDEVGVAVMCAAMGHERAQEKDGHGLFTRAVIEALRGGEGVPFNRSNRRVYIHHLQAFVFDVVSEQSGGRQHPFLSLPWVVESFPVAQLAGK
jgi:hypothetical protein